jgi:hypothetical protein
MVDVVPAAPQPEPRPPSPPLPSPEVRQARRRDARARLRKQPERKSVGNIISGTLCITAATGIVFAIAVPGLMSSQGARYSVRIEWERRAAELDAAAEQARKEGKLPPAQESRPRE